MPEIPLRTAAAQAVEAALRAADLRLAGYTVAIERDRDADVVEEDRPLLVVSLGDMEVLDPGDSLMATYLIRVMVVGYLGPPASATLAETMAHADELHARIVRALLRPGGAAALPAALPLGDNLTEVELRETGFRVEAASIAESDQPLASFAASFEFPIRAPWGSPFITIP